MLNFFYSPSAEKLSRHLIEHISSRPLSEPLSPEIIVVPHFGMARWLMLNFTDERGIAANFKFEFPSERIWNMLRSYRNDIPETFPSDREPMAWSIMKVLSENLGKNSFKPLQNYVNKGDSDNRQYRLWHLSRKIADAFDQYLVYRPDMILEWENDENYRIDTANVWQPVLWKELVNYWTNSESAGKVTHRVHLQNELSERLDSRNISLPERVSVFGVGSIPPAFLKIFLKTAKNSELSFYWTTPGIYTDDYDDQTVSEFVESLGESGIHFVEDLERNCRSEEGLETNFRYIPTDPKPGLNNVLQLLKFDMTTPESQKKSEKRGKDFTFEERGPENLSFHSCHSKRREVEVLYDQILELLNNNENLFPDDILIMTTEIDTYAPLIDAVFGTAEESLPQLPYNIMGQSIHSASGAVRTFISLLQLMGSRFRVTEVADIIESSVIREKYNFSSDELNRIEYWIEDNRVRWGIDGEFRKNEGLPPYSNYTWVKGLERMWYGYAMQADEENLIFNHFPYDDIEGSDKTELLGRLSTLILNLIDSYKESLTERSPVDWCDWLDKFIDRFFPEQGSYFDEISVIRQEIEKLRNHIKLVAYDEEIPFKIIHKTIKNEFESNPKSGVAGRGITFCGLASMRGVPFKVIGILGMNDGDFPRVKIPPEFDLISRNPLPGDRSKRSDDRYHFLEALISAKDTFLATYIGQSDRSDADFPPSVVIRELLDYITKNSGIPKNKLIHNHRLQGFNQHYFKRNINDQNNLFSYSELQSVVGRLIHEGSRHEPVLFTDKLPDPDDEWLSLTVDDLISFFQHPVKYLLNNRLNIYYREEKILNEDREDFKHGGLDRYRLGQVLLNRYLDGKEPASYRNIAAARDWIPYGYTGDLAFDQISNEVVEFGNEMKEYIDDSKKQSLELGLQIGSFNISGYLESIYTGGLKQFRFGRVRSSDLISFWIKHLLLNASNIKSNDKISQLYGKGTKKGSTIDKYQLNPVENSEELIQQLLELYITGLSKPICFFPESSFQYAYKRIIRGDSPERALNSVQNSWINPYTSYPTEGEDIYIQFVFKNHNPLKDNDFIDISTLFFSSFFNHEINQFNN